MTKVVVYVVELECMLCARPIGRARVASKNGPVPEFWLRQRCQTCGGQPVRSGEVSAHVLEPALNWDDAHPRIGRPPRWLVRQREQQAPA